MGFTYLKGISKIERGSVPSKEGRNKRRAVGISGEVIHNLLEKMRIELRQTNYQLI